ncbi:Ig-like domain-containing protein [Thioclava kandeliae]|uniref:Ig-like domain-containing protein n=1 Tax=Thioclava kandeliae TaxID=3070818 RepID=A0ABV1SGU1_9RHOB
MAKSVDFAVRDIAGGVSRGTVAGDGAGDFIQVGDGDAISLNLRKTNILKYERAGSDLHVVLTDGRVVELTGYFDVPSNKLYISADGEITQVNLEDSGEGVLFANYSEPEIIGKWSPNDELAFLDGDDILAPVEEDTAGMAGFAPLMGVGPLLAGGAALAGAAALGGGSGDDDDTTDEDDDGTTDDGNDEPDDEDTTDEDDDDTTDDGNEEPDDEDTTDEDDDDTTDDGDDEPDDEDTTDEDDDDTTDDGNEEPDDEDTTDDADAVTSDNIVNEAEVSSGFTLSGTTDTDATSVSVTLNGASYEAVIAEDGSWSAVIDDASLVTGDYTVSITATDAAGNVSTITDTVSVDTDMDVAFSSASVTSDNIVNAAEASAGFTLSGTTDTDAASVTVTLNGKSYDAVVAEDGSWTATVTDSALADGTYTATVTATDFAGNVATDTKAVTVDSSISVGINSTQMADNVISGSETTGVILTGTAEALSTVTISFGSGTRTVVAGEDGTWSANFAASEVPADTDMAEISATATDSYGNTATTSQTIKVDTVLDTLTVATGTPDSVLADGVVNASEASGGLLLTGTVEVGAQSVTVALADGTTVIATVDAEAGTWTATIDAADLPDSGDATETLTVTAVDAYGNSGSTTLDVVFDTVVENFSVASVTADNTVNGAEATEGFAISGTVEAGSTITVTIDQTGATQTIVVGEDGTWSAAFDVDDLPEGTGTATYSISATDVHGNVLDGTNASAANGSFIYDLEAPDSPDVTWATIQSGKVRAIYTDSDGEADSYTVSGINSDGTVTELDNSATATDDGSGEDIYSFDSQAMSTYFAVTDVDAAGNESSTLTVTSESEITLNLDRDGLDQFDFSKIDLDLADVNLTISADQIMAMTGHENTLVIEGDSDDSVNVSGMTVATDDAQDMDGYTLYTLDDGDAKLYVDDSISTTVI